MAATATKATNAISRVTPNKTAREMPILMIVRFVVLTFVSLWSVDTVVISVVNSACMDAIIVIRKTVCSTSMITYIYIYIYVVPYSLMIIVHVILI